MPEIPPFGLGEEKGRVTGRSNGQDRRWPDENPRDATPEESRKEPEPAQNTVQNNNVPPPYQPRCWIGPGEQIIKPFRPLKIEYEKRHGDSEKKQSQNRAAERQETFFSIVT